MTTDIKQLQQDLLTLGYNPGPIDGIMGAKTRAALFAYAVDTRQDESKPATWAQAHEAAETKRAEEEHPEPASFEEDTDGDGIPDHEDALPAVPATVKGVSPVIVRVSGNAANRKPDPRNFTKQQRVQIHITDYWPGEHCEGIKTNLYVSEQAVYEVHPVEAVIVKNYNDLYHIEVAGVTKERRVVVEKGRTYTRHVMVWTPEREALLEMAMVYAVESFRAQGVEIIFVTHCQTYKFRTIDPEIEIAQAAYRIAKKHGFKLDYDWVRGSGISAAKWYPAGCGKLG